MTEGYRIRESMHLNVTEGYRVTETMHLTRQRVIESDRQCTSQDRGEKSKRKSTSA